MADDAWSVAEAKAKFSEVIDKARRDGPQRVTRHGKDAVVVVSADDWKALTKPAAKRNFIEALLDPAAGVLTDEEAERLFARDKDMGRPVDL
jgi:prevent-host-death family protein